MSANIIVKSFSTVNYKVLIFYFHIISHDYHLYLLVENLTQYSIMNLIIYIHPIEKIAMSHIDQGEIYVNL